MSEDIRHPKILTQDQDKMKLGDLHFTHCSHGNSAFISLCYCLTKMSAYIFAMSYLREVIKIHGFEGHGLVFVYTMTSVTAHHEISCE